eukprot:Amastigsp_a511359_54.p8 type:complete len:102 gc:universal Amastigsp_a511359_54:363-58(-)
MRCQLDFVSLRARKPARTLNSTLDQRKMRHASSHGPQLEHLTICVEPGAHWPRAALQNIIIFHFKPSRIEIPSRACARNSKPMNPNRSSFRSSSRSIRSRL